MGHGGLMGLVVGGVWWCVRLVTAFCFEFMESDDFFLGCKIFGLKMGEILAFCL